MTTTFAPSYDADRSADRWTAALLLLVVAGTHLVLVPDHLEEAPYAGWLFLALGVVSVALAGVLVLRESPAAWALAGLVSAATLAAYVASRTVGLPQLGDDLGNWTEPMSFPAVAAELMLVALSVTVLRGRVRAARAT